MNLMFLCKQDNYEDLIMNYVAFAGILGIDNDFMDIQNKNHPKILDWIENPTDHAEFKLFKDPLAHDKKRQTTFCHRVTFGIVKYMYKVIYFYVMPLLVILMSFIGFNYWNKVDAESKDNVSVSYRMTVLAKVNKDAIKDKYHKSVGGLDYKVQLWIIYAVIFTLLKMLPKILFNHY